MSLASVSIKRPIFITCLVLAMLVLGFMGLKRMGVDLFPDVTLPVVSVQIVYPGAPPKDVEQLISKPIEEELGSLSGLKRLTSTNLDSVAVVIAEFALGRDIKEAEQQIRDRLGNIRRNLPAEIEDPIIRRIDPSNQAILRLAVSSDLAAWEVYDIVENQIKPKLDRISGVGLVNIIGGRKKEVQVLVDKAHLQQRELSVLQVAKAVQATSKDVPIGKVENQNSELSYRSTGEFQNLDALKRVTVSFIGSDRAVKLGEVAEVSEGLERERTRSILNGKPALFLDIFKQSGGNTVAVADLVTAAVSTINETLVQQGHKVKLDLVRDGSRPIRLNVADVKESILIGIVLCVLVVFFFLGSARSTLITGLALPNSLLGAFMLMYAFGFTINIMTLLALSLAVGLLIDDAIVVRENIFRYLENGKDPKTAAIEGTAEVSTAVIATTLVVIAVFGPIAFLNGVVGQFFKQFGLTIVFAIAISLFDALTIAPMLSAYLASASEHHKSGGIIQRMLNAFDKFQTRLENIYENVLNYTLKNPKTILGGAALIFVLSLGLGKFIPATFLPAADNGEFEVRLEMKAGTSLDATAQFLNKIDGIIRKIPEVDLSAITVGNANEEVNKGNIYIRLVPSKNRKVNTTFVKEKLRSDLKELSTEAKIIVTDYDSFGGGMRVFNLNLNGENLEELAAYVEKIKALMQKIPGLVDLDSNYRSGKPEFQVKFNREKAEALGVSTASAGAELRARVEGVVAASYRYNDNEYDVRVKLKDEDRDLKNEFNSTLVPNVNFNMIPLARVSEGVESTSFSQINRQDRGRFIQINGDVGAGGALNTIIKETQRIIEENPPPAGVNYAFVGQAQDFKELISNILLAMFLGILFIYLVLSSLYESFVTPFTILLALPLAMCGAFIALFVARSQIDIFSMIGIIMLLGVVAKNSILLVDYTNQLLEEGLSRKEALLKAGRTRLRPILMTSFALIAGTIPIAVGLNEASAQRTSMGIALIGGLISSTILTLVVVPAAFGYIDDFRMWSLKLVRRAQGKTLNSTENSSSDGVKHSSNDRGKSKSRGEAALS
jgi:hydrophobe/amphiphile efflux-1 (HAE1) family protein